MQANRPLAPALGLAAALLFALASCKSFEAGAAAGECFNNSKDEASCSACCKAAAPDGKPSQFTAGKCHCVMASGQVLP